MKIEELKWKYDRKQRYLAGVSGGPDSMALLGLLAAQGYAVVAAHVNYHHRPTADRDEQIVRDYCRAKGIELRVLRAGEPAGGNFQAWARRERYGFFRKVCAEEGLAGLFLGHQEDDLIETWLMQQLRGGAYECWGLRAEGITEGLQVYRPLLRATKAELQAYDDRHGIPYGIDESNLSDRYQRNRIRHSAVAKANRAERQAWLRAIREANRATAAERRKYARAAQCLRRSDLATFFGYPKAEQAEILRAYLARCGLAEAVSYPAGRLADIAKQLASPRNLRISLGAWRLDKDYGKLSAGPCVRPYRYLIAGPGEYPEFTVSDQGRAVDGAFAAPREYPLVIRSPLPGDKIRLRYGTKPLDRFFIDRKVPRRLRERWPVVADQRGRIILIPGIGCAPDHYRKPYNLYVKMR